MEYIFIYLLQLLDTIECLRIFSGFLFVLSGVLLIVLGFLTRFTYEKFEPDYYDISKDTAIYGSKIGKKICLISFCLTLALSFIPSKQTTLMLGGMYLGKKAATKIITSDKIQKIDTIINLELDKMIKDLKVEAEQ